MPSTPSPLKWAYGLTTVPSRKDTLLPFTMLALTQAGFPNPHLFVDGCPRDLEAQYEARYAPSPCTFHRSPLLTVGNWLVGLWELYVRNPTCHYYAMFQDDFVCYRNLRQYLEQTPYPKQGYLNLLTFPSNEQWLTKQAPNQAPTVGWHPSALVNPEDTRLNYQTGRGAVALVFSNEALHVLLAAEDLRNRPRCPRKPTAALDGCIAMCMNKANYTEYVHWPTLVQHTGKQSVMGNHPHPNPSSWLGEEFDALNLLPGSSALPALVRVDPAHRLHQATCSRPLLGGAG